MTAYLDDATAFCIEQVERGAEIGAEELHPGEESVVKLKDDHARGSGATPQAAQVRGVHADPGSSPGTAQS